MPQCFGNNRLMWHKVYVRSENKYLSADYCQILFHKTTVMPDKIRD